MLIPDSDIHRDELKVFVIRQETRSAVTPQELTEDVLPMLEKIIALQPIAVYSEYVDEDDGEGATGSHALLLACVFNVLEKVSFRDFNHDLTALGMLEFLVRFYALLWQQQQPCTEPFKHRPVVGYAMVVRDAFKTGRVGSYCEEKLKRLFAQLGHFVALPGTHFNRFLPCTPATTSPASPSVVEGAVGGL